jgi:uncharacterized membrane protein
MTSFSSTSKIGYIYNESTNTWHPIAGLANTSLDYSWTGTHDFSNPVTFSDVATAQAGINNFQNPTARDVAIPTPANGTVVFVRQDNSGNSINQIQYYSTSTSKWISYYDAQLTTKTANYVLALNDSGKTVNMNSSSAVTVTVPTNATVAFPIGTTITILQTGTGETSFVEASGVTIRSKNSYKKINTQYSGAQLVNLETDIWILIGDLKA